MWFYAENWYQKLPFRDRPRFSRLDAPLTGLIRILARAYFQQLNNVSYVAVGRTTCHAGTESARPSIAPLSEPQWGLPLTEPPRPYSLDYNRRSMSDGRKLWTPSISRTPAARRGEQSTNLLGALDAPLVCVGPPASSINTCPTYGRFQHLRVTESPNPSGQKSLMLPSDARS